MVTYMSDGIKCIHHDERMSVYKTTLEWDNTHLIKCKNCGTIIMQQRIGTHCNCGRILNSVHGIIVSNNDQFQVIDL